MGSPKTDISLIEVVASSVNKKLVVQGADWNLYKMLLKVFEGSNTLRFAFDDGFLEIKMPIEKHEIANRKLSSFVLDVCAEFEINCASYGSATIYNKSKAKGVDTDTSFYIHNEPFVRGLLEFDAPQPPPDLVIEVDVASPSLDKLPILAAFGVPEVWLYSGDRVIFFELGGENYKEIKNSLALPALDSATITEFLNKGLQVGSTDWLEAVHKWTQTASRNYQQLFALTSSAQGRKTQT